MLEWKLSACRNMDVMSHVLSLTLPLWSTSRTVNESEFMTMLFWSFYTAGYSAPNNVASVCLKSFDVVVWTGRISEECLLVISSTGMVVLRWLWGALLVTELFTLFAPN